MKISLPHQTWKDIESLIRKALNTRETYRTQAQNPSTAAAAWEPIMQLLSKFSENTFKDTEVTDINPYGKEVLVAFTEGIWAFGLGPALDDLDCPQIATDLFHAFVADMRLFMENSEATERPGLVALYSEVMNTLADYTLISKDTTARGRMYNSPRSGMAVQAWGVTAGLRGTVKRIKCLYKVPKSFGRRDVALL